MGKGPQWLLLQRRETNGQQALEKKLNILPFWGNTSQNLSGILLCIHSDYYNKKYRR